ncbi:hypothetical protein RF11_11706 [Thelohanellus kitauei]|uniref:Uncharacterized protein n=1 Tax=Thelohanellus kitauei TaxID=669202 RepID=A0A0C2J4L9_THEKT|nr:hypothetical protein RF11_11706 [Thelohanellus kitauei]
MNEDKDHLNIDLSDKIAEIWIRCRVTNLTDHYTVSHCNFTYYNNHDYDGYLTFNYPSTWKVERSKCIVYQKKQIGFRLQKYPEYYVQFEIDFVKISAKPFGKAPVALKDTDMEDDCEYETISKTKSGSENWIIQDVGI